MDTQQFDIEKEMYRLVDAANTKNIQLRAIGGLAVQVHNKKNHPAFIRDRQQTTP